MKASEANVLEFLKKSPQFTIPIYQRTYSWTITECAQLWDDIMRAGKSEEIAAHFIGSVVYIQDGIYQVSASNPLLVIDGQQRLTTISLLLEALARAVGDDEPMDGFSAAKIRYYYLLNHLESGDRAYKLLLTQTDRKTLQALVRQQDLPANASVRILENFRFFEEQIRKLKGNLRPLCQGISKLVMVDIVLDRTQDNPQLIFESMNSTGKELTQADLIRNFVLMGLKPDHQTTLYETHWRPMEEKFGQQGYVDHFDKFMRHYLTVRTGEIPNIRAVYEAFKEYSRRKDVENRGIDDLVADIHKMAGYYCAMALGQETNPQLADAFADLRELKVDVAYPFLLKVYEDYRNGLLSADDFVKIVRLVEAYVFRRAVCAIPTNSLNKTFATFARAIRPDRYLESVQAHFLSLPSYRRFPSDAEFKRELMTRDLYNFRSRSYWLRRLENYGRKERISLADYTIEHILPQNENLSPAWQQALGPNWKQVQETWLHTLGNLTLTAYNAEYSDRPFPEKRDMPGGFRESPLHLNQGLADVKVWNEAAIRQRAERLAALAVQVWAAPALPQTVLADYRTAAQPGKRQYTLDHYEYLKPGSPMRPIFDAFRREVLALDSVVTEELLKQYIAYKAETNFVDVVPQKSRLRLSLNMRFHEIEDPRGLCLDVTNRGRWGNGDVEIGLDNLADLPYVMFLVRQALEKQLGNGEDL